MLFFKGQLWEVMRFASFIGLSVPGAAVHRNDCIGLRDVPIFAAGSTALANPINDATL